MIFVGNIIMSSGFSMFFPFLSIYFNNRLGISMSAIGLVWLFIGIAAAVSETVGGMMADRLGRRKVMLAGMGMRATIFTLVTIAVALEWGFVIISGLIILAFLLSDIVNPALNAMIADVVAPSKRLEAYSVVRVGGNLGFAVGVMVGGIMAVISYSLVFAVAALSSAIYFLIVLFRIPESIPSFSRERESIRSMVRPFKDSTFLIFTMAAMFLFILLSQMNTTLPTFINDTVGMPEYEIGLVYALNGMMIVLLQIPLSRRIKGYDLSMLFIGSVLFAVSYSMVAWANGLWYMMMVMVFITMAEMIVSPAAMNMVARLSPESMRGRYMGAYGLMLSTGCAFGPFIGGVVIDRFTSPLMIWGTLSTLGLMAAVGFIYLKFVIGRGEGATAPMLEKGQLNKGA